ncbi:uncharacterized protein LOC134068912 [Sardina pilchardus]|uniref:uncharacterized protein LOC134068912 n=1 Tax=Sardina pilchardus TaxID=27697 RepID=UPI002E0EEC9B
MACCFAPLCKHRSGGPTRCSLYRFPANDAKRRLWTRALRRADRKPNNNSRVCSCHFPKGKDHPPVLFPDGLPKNYTMARCAATGCTNQSNEVLKMYSFPTETDRRAKWLEMVSRKDLDFRDKLCQAHFEEDQFVGAKRGQMRLKSNAVPTIFPDHLKPERTVFPDHPKPERTMAPLSAAAVNRMIVDHAYFKTSISGLPEHEVQEEHPDQEIPSLNEAEVTDKERLTTVTTPTSETVACPPIESYTGSAGVLATKAVEVKEEDIIEFIVGEPEERTAHTTNVSESPETHSIEGPCEVGTWEQATVENTTNLKFQATTTQIAQAVISNLKNENDFLRVQIAKLVSELSVKQWTHEQEVRDLQERLALLKQKCSCGAMSESTNTTSEAAHSNAMVVEIKTEPL